MINRYLRIWFVMIYCWLYALVGLVNCGAILNNTAITFEMSGATTYTPDIGGVTKNGYKLRIGFSRYQWLAVQFVSTSKNDLLVIQIDQFYTSSSGLHTGHQVTAGDYFISSDIVSKDQNTDNDISAVNYAANKDYYIDLIRYKGSNSGQDWNAAAYQYSLTQICFYTSQNLADINDIKSGISQCYSYEINNYISTFKGEKLKEFYLNGYKTQINGWIDGPYVNANLYFYHSVPLFSYTKDPAVGLEIGTTENQAGQDFYIYSPGASESGDFYGPIITNMSKDNTKSGGFQNGKLQVKYWNTDPANQIAQASFTALRATFSRNISTHDPYDKTMKSTVVFCIYLYTEGTTSSLLSDKKCEIIELASHYPRMTMPKKKLEQTTFLMTIILSCIAIFLLS